MNRKEYIFMLMFPLFLVGFITGTALCQDYWWQSRYKDLIKAVDLKKKGRLSASYRVGPEVQSREKILLYRDRNDSLILRIELPQQSIPKKEKKTGRVIHRKFNPVITFRDHDLDGSPDDYQMVPRIMYKRPDNVEFTKDGFIKIKDIEKGSRIIKRWSNAIGFLVNRFL